MDPFGSSFSVALDMLNLDFNLPLGIIRTCKSKEGKRVERNRGQG